MILTVAHSDLEGALTSPIDRDNQRTQQCNATGNTGLTRTFGNVSVFLMQNYSKLSHAGKTHLSKAKQPKKSKKSEKKEPLWSMLPERHRDVLLLLKDCGLKFKFHNENDSISCTEDWDTNVMGRFSCRNRDCSSRGWPSKAIAMIIRLYPNARYNARIYHQRCIKCNTPGRLEEVDESYTERVSYWLKRWSGVQVEAPQHSYKKTRAPHRKDLCEGCKAGHCKLGKQTGF